MAQEVFISYSSKDKIVADAACAVLEARGVRCWMAPRDILPGSEWGASIIEAISSSKVMVLIYTSNSNASPQVRREVERAVARGLHVIPFRMEDVPMSPALEYFISSPHWLDAINPPMERHLDHLAKIIRAVVDAQKSGASPMLGSAAEDAPTAWAHGPPPGTRAVQQVPSSASRPTSKNTKLMIGVGAASVAVVGVIIGIVVSRPDAPKPTASDVQKAEQKAAPTEPPQPALQPPPVVTKEPEKPAVVAPTPPPTPPAVAKNASDDDVKRFWELLAEGSPRLPRLQELLEDYPALANRKNTAGDTPLFAAAKAGQVRLISALLASGADRKELSSGNNTALHGAAMSGITDASIIESLAPGNLDVKNSDGRTALQVAVIIGNAETMTRLVAAGADVNAPHKDGRAPMQRAMSLDDPAKAHAMALALIAAGAKVDVSGPRGNTPLHYAAGSGDTSLVTAFLDHDAKIDRTGVLGRTALHSAVLAGKVDTIKALTARKATLDIADDEGNTPLHLAATLNETATAEALLAAGAKVTTATKEKLTPLHVAAASGNAAMVELFMRNGGAAVLTGPKPTPVDVAEKADKKEVAALLRRLEFPAMLQSAIKSANQPVPAKLLEMIRKNPKLGDATAADGRNVLHQCAASGNAAFATELAKINPVWVKAFSATEETPLHIAAMNKQAGVAKVLLAAGASPRATMRNGDTPLHVAAKVGAKDVAKLILEVGADPAVTNKAGQTAAELASDASTRELLAAAEAEAAPIREAWTGMQLENRSFDVSAPGLTSPLRIRFKDRTNFSVEGELNGVIKSFEGTYTKGPLTLAIESSQNMFPTIVGSKYVGKIAKGVEQDHFAWRIGSVEISFDKP